MFDYRAAALDVLRTEIAALEQQLTLDHRRTGGDVQAVGDPVREAVFSRFAQVEDVFGFDVLESLVYQALNPLNGVYS